MTNDRRAFVLVSLVAATSLTVNLNFPAPAQATDSVVTRLSRATLRP
jgi:hypothetical protein